VRRRRVAAAATVIALAAVLAPRPVPTVATHSENARLPDLAVLAPRDFRIVVRDSGRRLLRFTTIIVNIGNGPFQLSGYDDDGFAAKKDILSVNQQILEPDGTFSRHHTDATMFWSGDGHDHWHVTDLQVSKLQNLENEEVGSVKKVGFCFVDNFRYGSSQPPHYTQAIDICFTKANGRVPMGISKNWGDTYPWTFKYQWVDITDLPNGKYRLRVIADPAEVPGGLFVESDETNNVGWARIRIQGQQVTVLNKSARP
jgi:Lysyl oxidase